MVPLPGFAGEDNAQSLVLAEVISLVGT
jgi:hypothetical protein